MYDKSQEVDNEKVESSRYKTSKAASIKCLRPLMSIGKTRISEFYVMLGLPVMSRLSVMPGLPVMPVLPVMPGLSVMFILSR